MKKWALCCVILAAGRALAQDKQSGRFEELSRQAEAELQNNPEAAIKLYREALAIRSDWAEGWFYLGAAYYERNEMPESQQAFQRAAKLAPDNGTVWSFLGLSEYQMSHYEQALADIRKGEALGLGDNKQFISTVRNRGALICLRSGEFGQAMEQLQPLAAIGDDSGLTIEAFGVTALGIPSLPGAVPPNQQSLVQLAGRAAWALAAEREDEARTAFQDLIARYANEPGVHYLYGIYLLAHDQNAAAAEFRKELEVRPKHVPARLQLAGLEIKAGNPQNAVLLARDAISLQPGNVFAHLMLGRALLSANQFEQAIAELEAAVKLDPQKSQPHFYLEQAYRRAGRTAEAQKESAEFARLKATQDPLFRPDYVSDPVQ